MRLRSPALIRRGISIAVILVLFACGGGLWRMVMQAREAARSSTCHGNMYFLGHALRNYHDVERAFPPAFVTDAKGRPLYSWRVLISPYCEQRDIIERYDREAPWDDPANLHLAQKDSFVFLFACPSDPRFVDPRDRKFDVTRPQFTNYVAIVGDGTVFPGGGKPIALSEIADGPENTILLAEIANSDIHWSQPRDLRFDQMSFAINHPTRPSISSPHAKGPGVVFADGRYYRIAESISPEAVKALITINGAEELSRDELVRQELLK